MNADVHYRAAGVVSRDFPLRMAETKLSLKDGVLTLAPVTFAFAKGTLIGDVRIDARKDVPVSDIDVRLGGLGLEQFVPNTAGPSSIEGQAVARAKLHGVGNSIHKAASTADGSVTFVPHGQIRNAFAELLGINVASALGLLLSGDQTQVDVRCAVANFSTQDGIMSLSQFALDTPVVLATAEGRCISRMRSSTSRFRAIRRSPSLSAYARRSQSLGRLRIPLLALKLEA
jgi:uncharacterized protein involved in outer membrane biogenesis